ncbi:hypothetical protein P154DRAFT_484110 [Amniculicola lignicola CBS 123094]|uniref:Cupin type-2 domain-containing protein n=1 Tax=Amniculicola lignicola CBS 123094 TaxID=1392246 RepID=A0A6A5WSH2_9PLEO|nr:hypothetical protein P154DRAFT_484110 [Amniculicola lignicola CBS 123094]
MSSTFPHPWTPSASSLPPAKRYITTHRPTGLSTLGPSPPLAFAGDPTSHTFSRSYTLSSVPADITADADITLYTADAGPNSRFTGELVNTCESGSGAAFVTVDFAPGGRSDMHRTASVDWVVVVQARFRMELDSGESVILNPGDQVVQRGTMHKWFNASETEPARFVAVLLPTKPYNIPGTGELLKEVRDYGE